MKEEMAIEGEGNCADVPEEVSGEGHGDVSRRIISGAALCLFFLVILIPALMLDTTPEVASEIDNRMLAENPFTMEPAKDRAEFTDRAQAYISDRIGFRDEMILAYTVLNDRLFGKMSHPIYSYGKEGYVFGSGITTKENEYFDYHTAFANMVHSIQYYCNERDVPFLFVFEPAKPAVLSEYLPDGIVYDRSWVTKLFEDLDERGIRYVDNTDILREKHMDGERVFNQKYDANHWNDLGAFYGTNSILAELRKDFSAIRENDISEFSMGEKLETTLAVSRFPIHEYVPDIGVENDSVIDESEQWSAELEMDERYKAFGYYKNLDRQAEGSPRVLVFQGSYMNNYGAKYLRHAFGEYIYVHDYQNILNFPYYFSIFQPDCVVFEVAEYTFQNEYFDGAAMLQLDFNPPLTQEDRQKLANPPDGAAEMFQRDDMEAQIGEKLTALTWRTDTQAAYVWLLLDGSEYNMKQTDGGYETVVRSDQWRDDSSVKIAVHDGESMRYYTADGARDTGN